MKGEGVAFGLSEQVSPQTMIPDEITDGQRVNAFVLAHIADEYGVASVRALDAALYPCPLCGMAFYSREGWGICDRCDSEDGGDDGGLVTIHDQAVRLELAGAYSPRCDY
jgi:ribosomal protein L37AE/L43A